jgi:anti-anti-sigma factor
MTVCAPETPAYSFDTPGRHDTLDAGIAGNGPIFSKPINREALTMENASFSFDGSSQTLTFAFSGRLNTDICVKNDPEIAGTIARVLQENPPQSVSIVFDIGRVEYVSSLFLRTVIKSSQEVPKGKFKLTGANDLVRKMIQVSGLDMLILN